MPNPLIKAVLEQTEELEEIGGFCTDTELTQYVRDVREIARQFEAAEKQIKDFKKIRK